MRTLAMGCFPDLSLQMIAKSSGIVWLGLLALWCLYLACGVVLSTATAAGKLVDSKIVWWPFLRWNALGHMLPAAKATAVIAPALTWTPMLTDGIWGIAQ